METGLKDRVAIVAAASQGLGLAAARGLAAEGMHLAICSRSQTKVDAVADQIHREFGVQVLAMEVDVTDYAAVQRLVNATAQRFGRMDVCVTNAGGPPAKGFLATTVDEWQRMVDL